VSQAFNLRGQSKFRLLKESSVNIFASEYFDQPRMYRFDYAKSIILQFTLFFHRPFSDEIVQAQLLQEQVVRD
jgi:hypothetical protein